MRRFIATAVLTHCQPFLIAPVPITRRSPRTCHWNRWHPVFGALPLSMDGCGKNSTETGLCRILPQAELAHDVSPLGLMSYWDGQPEKEGEPRGADPTWFLRRSQTLSSWPVILQIIYYRLGFRLPCFFNIDSWTYLTPTCKFSLAPHSGANFAACQREWSSMAQGRTLILNVQRDTWDTMTKRDVTITMMVGGGGN